MTAVLDTQGTQRLIVGYGPGEVSLNFEIGDSKFHVVLTPVAAMQLAAQLVENADLASGKKTQA